MRQSSPSQKISPNQPTGEKVMQMPVATQRISEYIDHQIQQQNKEHHPVQNEIPQPEPKIQALPRQEIIPEPRQPSPRR